MENVDGKCGPTLLYYNSAKFFGVLVKNKIHIKMLALKLSPKFITSILYLIHQCSDKSVTILFLIVLQYRVILGEHINFTGLLKNKIKFCRQLKIKNHS